MFDKTGKSKLVVRLVCVSSFLLSQANAQHSTPQESSGTATNFKRRLQAQQKMLSQELSRLERANPVVDLRESLKKSDLRFISYHSFTEEVPGVKQGQGNAYVLKYGTKIIRGTSDVITQGERQRLQKVLYKYVIPYNQLLLRHLQKARKLTQASRHKAGK